MASHSPSTDEKPERVHLVGQTYYTLNPVTPDDELSLLLCAQPSDEAIERGHLHEIEVYRKLTATSKALRVGSVDYVHAKKLGNWMASHGVMSLSARCAVPNPHAAPLLVDYTSGITQVGP